MVWAVDENPSAVYLPSVGTTRAAKLWLWCLLYLLGLLSLLSLLYWRCLLL